MLGRSMLFGLLAIIIGATLPLIVLLICIGTILIWFYRLIKGYCGFCACNIAITEDGQKQLYDEIGPL